jgi:hypothetical protein
MLTSSSTTTPLLATQATRFVVGASVGLAIAACSPAGFAYAALRILTVEIVINGLQSALEHMALYCRAHRFQRCSDIFLLSSIYLGTVGKFFFMAGRFSPLDRFSFSKPTELMVQVNGSPYLVSSFERLFGRWAMAGIQSAISMVGTAISSILIKTSSVLPQQTPSTYTATGASSHHQPRSYSLRG